MLHKGFVHRESSYVAPNHHDWCVPKRKVTLRGRCFMCFFRICTWTVFTAIDSTFAGMTAANSGRHMHRFQLSEWQVTKTFRHMFASELKGRIQSAVKTILAAANVVVFCRFRRCAKGNRAIDTTCPVHAVETYSKPWPLERSMNLFHSSPRNHDHISKIF